MNKIMKVTLLLAFAFVSFGAYRYGAAQERGPRRGLIPITPPAFDVLVSQNPEALATKHLLEGTYINTSSVDDEFLPGGTLTPVDAQLTVACPGTSGTCTIQADMWVQTGGSDSIGNETALCLYVDGKIAADCPITGETPTDSSYTAISFSQSLAGLPHGNHTVQTYFFSTYGTFVWKFTSNYRVYKP